MKSFYVCLGMMIIMLGVWVEVSTAQTITETDMPDANLRAAVLARLKIFGIVDSTATTFTRNDMVDARFISLFEYLTEKITDLTGLNYATRLTVLNLHNNEISDMSVVASLTNLTSLNLSRNNISNISAVSGLTALTNLNLSRNNISNISAVSGLTALTSLGINDNSISNISAVSGLTALINLNLSRNNISNISAVSGLTALTNLNLSKNNISNISAVSGLTALTSLRINNNSISDISAVFGLTKLKWLYLHDNSITEVSQLQGLSSLTNLEELYLDADFKNDLQALSDVNALKAFLYVSLVSPRDVPLVSPRERKIIIYECPVGWQRHDRFGGPTQRVLLYEVKLQMDLHNRISIYKPDSVAIYVHPDEGLENLEGWKLHVAVPYNHHREYLLTAENSVVVDSEIEGVEGGFAFIESPEEAPFPMVGMGFTGAAVPGFDYRLYDDMGRRVDFGIACYKRGGIFQALKDMEDPRVLRKVHLERLDWDAATYIRSEWTVPVETSLGTPGYPNDIVSDDSLAGRITFSELMYATRGGLVSSQPQWIELYNNTGTAALPINLNGWQLLVEARDSEIQHRYSVIELQEDLYIAPNQTVLLVTRDRRHSGHLREGQVYNLFHHDSSASKLGLRQNAMLPTSGFLLQLFAPDGTLVDTVGNLDGRKITRDAPAWQLPSGWVEDGARTSLLRRYEDSTALVGTDAKSWVRAADVALPLELYYGHETDIGSPGYKEGGIAPVMLSHFRARRTEAGVIVEWATVSETDNAGFNILRGERKTGSFVKVNPTLILGGGTMADKQSYIYRDPTAAVNIPYDYRLEEVSLSGERHAVATVRLRGHLSATGKLLWKWADVKKQ